MSAYRNVSQEEPLLSSSSLDSDNISDSTIVDEKAKNATGLQRIANRASRPRTGHFLASGIANIVLLVSFAVLYARYQKRDEWLGVPKIWTPADHINEHVYVRFPDVHDITNYTGPPSPEIDRAWEDLYGWGISEISKSDAAKLEGPTAPFMSQPDKYIVEMDVFHQLHCLNALRKSLYPDYYPAGTGLGIAPRDHLEHCVQVIRESLMCSADTHPNRWVWFPALKVSDPHFDSVHVCRNWDAIRELSKEITAKRVFDKWNSPGSDLKYPADPFKGYEVVQRHTHTDLYEWHHYNFTFLEEARPKPSQHAGTK